MRKTEDPEKRNPVKVAAGRKGGETRWAKPEDERGNWRRPGPNSPVNSPLDQAQAIAAGDSARMPGVKPGSNRWGVGIGPKGSKWNPGRKRPAKPKNQFFHVTLMSYQTLERNRNRLKGRKVRKKSDPEWDPLPFSTEEFRAEMLKQAVAATEKAGFENCRWVCPYTGKNFGLDEFSCDHLIPRSRGGPDTLENLVACRKIANKAKGALTAKEFEEILIPMRRWEGDRMDKTLRQWASGASIQAMWFRKSEKKAGGVA